MDFFTLPLALFNFLPVLLTALALALLVRLVGRLRPDLVAWAIVSYALIFAGGLSKAVWKLIATLSGSDLQWLANALFPLIGPGFFLLAVVVWMSFYRPGPDPRRTQILVVTLLAIALAVAVAALRTWGMDVERGWFLPFMLLTTLGNLGLMVLLIRRGWQLRRWGAVALLGINLVVVFGLQPIAMAGADTLALHWLEQVMTALGATAFAAAMWLLLRAADSGNLGRRPQFGS